MPTYLCTALPAGFVLYTRNKHYLLTGMCFMSGRLLDLDPIPTSPPLPKCQ